MSRQKVAVVETVEKTFVVGGRVRKLCVKWGEERGHVIASLTKRGKISRVSCPKCGTAGSFKSGAATGTRRKLDTGAPYDQTRAYRPGPSPPHRPTHDAPDLRARRGNGVNRAAEN